MFTQFYFDLIRKYIICFGSLFNDIRISRTDSNGNVTMLERVPLTYGPKDAMLARVIQDPTISRPTAVYPLPMMSFEIVSMDYDPTRKLQTVVRMAHNDPTDNSKRNYQYVPVPYNINFKLSVLAKNSEDGTKIMEQILPYFTPDWTVTAELIPEMNIKNDIPIVLQNVQLDDVYEEGFKERRSMVWNLDFVLKGYFYGPVKTSKVIKYTDANLYVPKNIDELVGIPDVAAIYNQPGLTANGQPTSNASLSIPVNQILANSNYGYVTTITETH